MSNIVEELRRVSVTKLFATNTMTNCFPVWKTAIDGFAPTKTPALILGLGDHLSEIFRQTGTAGRGQGEVSSGGTAWESLVCWYLNLCLIGRRTVVIRHNRDLIPSPVSDAITVNYHNFASNTESDLIAITFPEKEDYCCDKHSIVVYDDHGSAIRTISRGGGYNLKKIMNALCERDFHDLEIHIIQCKTNWNDNAQIPMLWDAVYAAKNFRNGVSVGKNNFSVSDVARFTYSFVTVPTNKLDGFKADSVCVKRVMNLSGGNYWGHETENDVAASVKEMLHRNLLNGHSVGHRVTLAAELPDLGTEYSYFSL